MVKSKKLLSLFLAVVMAFSVLTVMASAYKVGPAVDGYINYKYTVEKVATVPETEAGSVEWSADNIYAVTAWMKCNTPVTTMTIPFHYNKALFSPITLSDGEYTYPYGAGLDQDTYYTDMGEGSIYAYSLGDYMNNTGMYKADGSNATTQALAKCIGLGNSNSAGIDIITELVSPDHPLYNRWCVGLPENTGILFASLDVAGKTKTAYFNTIEGITTSTDWNRMFTVYFEAISDDVDGAKFGVFTDDCFTVDGVTDTAGSYFVNATTSKVGNPEKNVVENAVVEAGPSVVVTHVKQQSKWNGGNNKNTAENYLFGFVGQVSGLTLTTEKVGDRDMVNEINSITATATINGQTVTSDVVTVWAVDGGYQFRAQFAGFTPDMTYSAEVTFAVTMADGTTVYTSGAASRVINDIYTASVANGLPALAA